MVKPLSFTLILSVIGALINLLPAPFNSEAVFAYGFSTCIFIALRYGWRYSTPASLIVSIPLLLQPLSPFPFLLILHTLFIAYCCYKQSNSRLVTATLSFWLLIAMPVYGMQLVWLGQPIGFVEIGVFLTNFINALASCLFGHFVFIGISILWPAPDQTPIKMGFLFRYFFTGLFFFAITIVTFVYIGFSQREQVEELNAYLQQRSEVVAAQVDAFLRSHSNALDITSKAIQDTPSTADQRLAGIANAYPGYLTFLITDDKGYITHAYPPELLSLVIENDDLDVSFRSYFTAPKLSGELYVSSAFKGKGFGSDPIVAISSPILSNNLFAGVMEGSLDLSSFASYDDQEINQKVAVVITDPNDVVVFASPVLGIEPLEKLQDTSCQSYECNSQLGNIADWIYSKVESDQYNWKITKLYPRQEFASQVSEYVVIAILFLILLTLIANFASMLVAIAFSKPLNALIKNFGKFDPSNPTFENIQFNSKQYLEEIAKLDAGFDQLRLRLVQLFGQLNHANNKQEKLNTELTQLNSSLEERVTEKTSSLEIALKQANQASEAKTRFLANMSHEIRTPMNGILGSCQNLQDADLDDRSRRRLDVIQQSAKALMDILNGILDWSKIESGKMTVEASVFDLPEQLTNCVELHRYSAQEKGIKLSINMAEDMPDFVSGDSTKLNQILNNLLSNAIKFTEQGFVEVDARYHRGYLLLSVKDSGIGIEHEHKSQVFEEFAQADLSTTRNYGGTGLGLAISQGLANLMGGQLGLDSEVGVGTTLSLKLPLRLARKPTAEQKQAVTLPQNLKILLAEDNDINAEILLDMLRSSDRNVRCIRVADGQQALDAVQRHKFDLLLMDCQMPVMDGFDATRAIRLLPDNKGVLPIIALTANAYSEDRQRCLDAGMNEHIAKPVNKETLFTVLSRCLLDFGFLTERS